MSRFSNPISSGEGGDLPQPLATTSSPTFNKITLTSNGATDNITIGDDVILGDGNVANHIVIIGQQDATAGGIVLGTNETEVISTDGTDLSITAGNDIVLLPGSNYAYLNVVDPDHRLATMSDISSGGGSADLGDFVFTAGTATVNENETLKITANDSDEVRTQLVLDPNNGIVKLEAFTNQNSNTFYASNPDWDSSTWVTDGGNGSVITFVNAPNIINFMSTEFNNLNNVKISVNGGTAGTWSGGSYGPSDITIYIAGVLPPEDTTINDFSFLHNEVSLIEINQDNGEINIQTQSGNDINISAGDDMYITAQGDDLFLRANDDIRFVARYNDLNLSEQQWTMNSEGQLHFPGDGYIENVIDGSGDGNGYDTFKIVPDDNLVSGNGSDQYLIIDPTSPNHIHIRAGGTPDASTADLFLGGERNKVQISDQYDQVQISTNQGATTNEYQNLNTEISTQFIISSTTPVDYGYTVNVNGTSYVVDSVNDDTPEVGLRTLTANGATFDPNGWYEFTYQPDGTHNWTFGSNGLLTGPAQGFINVTGFVTPESYDLALNASASVVLNGSNGEFLDDPNDALNQIATMRDIANVGEEFTTVEESFVVAGGSAGTQPTFDGDPLFSGTYVKIGPQVHVQIQVDMDNITNFGTGQYYVELPFNAKYDSTLRSGCLHDFSNENEWAISGHVDANSNVLNLFFTSGTGQDELFDHNSPIGLDVADNFHIAGTYISA